MTEETTTTWRETLILGIENGFTEVSTVLNKPPVWPNSLLPTLTTTILHIALLQEPGNGTSVKKIKTLNHTKVYNTGQFSEKTPIQYYTESQESSRVIFRKLIHFD